MTVHITQLVCPLCGRFVSLRFFDPSRLDPDIYVVEVAGFGRGRGVQVVDRYSILHPDNPPVERIMDRLLALIEVLLDHRCVTPEDMLQAVHPADGESDEDVDEEGDEYYDEAKDECIDEDEGGGEKNRVGAFKKRVRDLINEYAALATENE